MTERSIAHGSFTIERDYNVPPARAFKAWADPAIKAKWFGAGASEVFDFREGGREFASGAMDEKTTFTFEVRYYDIVPDNRIVYTYEMAMNGARLSVSVATVEFRADGKGTKLVLREDGAFLDGLDTVDQRRAGTEMLLNQLGTVLTAEG
jgi:uncharacterized protein YndB with AHSA1/START domain